MKVLVTGSKGMLGTDITEVFSKTHEVVGVDSSDFDITDLCSTLNEIKKLKPDVVIHTAAFTDVDRCEIEIENALKINSLGTRNVAVACEEVGSAIVYISTDYVFDGAKNSPYFEFDSTNPLSIYGRSKVEGENFVKSICRKHYVVRTSWLFGRNGKNFVRTMLKLAKENKAISVVDDQTGSPTYTYDLAQALLQLIQKPAYGTYHITNEGYCTWYDFANLIFDIVGAQDIKIRPISSEEFGRPATRPKNSRLEKLYLRLNGYSLLRSYKDSVKEYIENYCL